MEATEASGHRGLPEDVTFELRPEGPAREGSGPREFQAERAASAEVPGQDWAWGAGGTRPGQQKLGEMRGEERQEEEVGCMQGPQAAGRHQGRILRSHHRAADEQ